MTNKMIKKFEDQLSIMVTLLKKINQESVDFYDWYIKNKKSFNQYEKEIHLKKVRFLFDTKINFSGRIQLKRRRLEELICK